MSTVAFVGATFAASCLIFCISPRRPDPAVVVPESPDRPEQTSLLPDPPEANREFLGIEGFDEVIARPELHGSDRVPDLAVRGYHDHRNRGTRFPEPGEEFDFPTCPAS
jgi:hypothetical protein